MKVKDLLQKIVSKERGQRLLTRYSVPLGFVVALTLWLDYLILSGSMNDHLELFLTIIFSLCFGLFWAVAQQMSEYRMRKDENGKLLPKPIVIQVLGQVIIIVESAILCSMGKNFGDATWLGHASAVVALLTGMTLLPFWKHKDDRHIVRWNADCTLTGIACYLVVGVAVALIAALLGGISSLFDIDINDKVYGVTCTTIAVLGGGCLLLLLLPDAEKTNKLSQTGERFCDRLGNYLLLPVTCLYILVLYAYIVKIVVTWELPNGGVAWMTTAMMAITLASLFLRYKNLYTEEDTTYSKIVRRGLPLATLPCLILMTVGFARRIHDYGWTPTRGYLCAVIVWFFFAVGLLLWADWQKRKGQTPRIISLLVISLSLLFVATSIVPKANIYTICKAIERADEQPTDKSEKSITIFKIDNHHDELLLPEGYRTFRPIWVYSYNCEMGKPTNDEQGRWVFTFTSDGEKFTVHFDAEQSQTGDYVDLYTEEGLLIRVHYLTITEHEGNRYIEYLSGYLFKK